jgi:hypothetical protein
MSISRLDFAPHVGFDGANMLSKYAQDDKKGSRLL